MPFHICAFSTVQEKPVQNVCWKVNIHKDMMLNCCGTKRWVSWLPQWHNFSKALLKLAKQSIQLSSSAIRAFHRWAAVLWMPQSPHIIWVLDTTSSPESVGRPQWSGGSVHLQECMYAVWAPPPSCLGHSRLVARSYMQYTVSRAASENVG